MNAEITGSYLLTGHDGAYAVERFACGDTAAGWGYAATRHEPASGALLGRIELTTTRLHVEAGGWVLRAGTLGSRVLWRRGEREGEAVAVGLTGTSPAYDVALIRLFGLAVGEQRRVRLLAVTEPVLATRLVDEQWHRTATDRYEAIDLATGEGRWRQLDADLVVAGAGLTLTRL